MYAIEFKKVHKSFEEVSVLNGVDFSIHKGKITTILGFSGAGKSTLLKHILGLLAPTTGDVFILDQNLKHLNELKLRDFRKNYGMLFQYAALFDSFSAFDNIAFPLREFTKMNEVEIKEKVNALIEAVGLPSDSGKRLPSELSGGMRKRVGLARALALSPKIMLYDEPTTGLDPITTKMVNDLIRSTAEKNAAQELTSVIISHDIEATLKISDYVAFLDKGRIIEHLPASEFRNTKNPIIRQFIDL